MQQNVASDLIILRPQGNDDFHENEPFVHKEKDVRKTITIVIVVQFKFPSTFTHCRLCCTSHNDMPTLLCDAQENNV
uniref:Uncharacterized protein n=1 Tax=Angiostrongylus cantonensis TaxID=6313 RepID=A0A0K0CWY6_ANGCA